MSMKVICNLMMLSLLSALFWVTHGISSPQQTKKKHSPNRRLQSNLVLSGGPQKDQIPAIDQPQFVTPRNSIYNMSEIVLGLAVNGEAKAYPYSILNWHEIINDTVGGYPVSITYCPLCDTGIAYIRKIGHKVTTFGVSGKLYNSCLIMYDRQTDSLWVQPWGTAVEGPQVNQNLARLPIIKTSLSKWVAKHPNTKILSSKTGYKRDYNSYPYGDYFNSKTLFFPITVTISSDQHPKEAIQIAWAADNSHPFNAFGGRAVSVKLTDLQMKGFIMKRLAKKHLVFIYDTHFEAARSYWIPEPVLKKNNNMLTLESGKQVRVYDLIEAPSTSAFAFVYPALFGP